MSGYPNYNSPQGWKPPAYNPPSFGPQFTPPGSVDPNAGRPKPSGEGSGCALAAFLVFLFVGVPLLIACAGFGYLIVSVSKNVEQARAKFEADNALRREEAAKAFPQDFPGGPASGLPGGLQNPPPGFLHERNASTAREAIEALRSGDWQRQKQGAQWLADNPVEEEQRAQAAAALEALLEGFHRDVAETSLKALATWGSKESSPKLVAAMKEHRLDRKLAIEQLGKWQDPAAAAALAELLADAGPDGAAALKALEQIGPPAQEAVQAQLDPQKPLANERAERLLAGYGVDPADAAISARLAGFKLRGFERSRAIKALAAMPLKPERQQEVARAFDAIVGGADRQDREEAMAGLLVWGDEESVPAVIRYLKSETFTNKNALTFLGQINDPRAVEPLAALLDNNFVDDAELTKALAAYGAEGERAVLGALHDPRRRARDRARAILTSLDARPDTLLTQTLADLASPEDRRARSALEWLAMATIEKARQKEVTGKLLEATRHTSSFVQGSALEALVKLDDPAIVPDLVPLLANPSTRGRLHFAFTKAGPAAEDLLIEFLAQDDLKVVGFACQALIQSGTEKSLVPLQDALTRAEAAKDLFLAGQARGALNAVKQRSGK